MSSLFLVIIHGFKFYSLNDDRLYKLSQMQKTLLKDKKYKLSAIYSKCISIDFFEKVY